MLWHLLFTNGEKRGPHKVVKNIKLGKNANYFLFPLEDGVLPPKEDVCMWLRGAVRENVGGRVSFVHYLFGALKTTP